MPIDPYTSRLETNMRLLSDRLAWLDAQARGLAAENGALRRELDLRTSQIETDARQRANRIVAAAEERAATLSVDGTEQIERRHEALAGQVEAVERGARVRIEELKARAAVLAEGTPAVKVVMVHPEAEAGAGVELAAEPEPPEPGPDEAELEARREEAELLRAEVNARRERVDALQAEVDALVGLRETIVTGIRETLVGMAEELARAEGEPATDPVPDELGA